MTTRFARVEWRGNSRWIELLGDGEGALLADSQPVHRAAHERKLDRAEVSSLPILAPFFGVKIIGLALNYRSLLGARDHYDEPLYFLKSPSSACPNEGVVTYPRFAHRVWVEVELAAVIGEPCRDVSPEEAAHHILGFTVAADVTAENVAGRDHHLGRSKAIDGFAPMGPTVVRGIDTSNLRMSTEINGAVFQVGSTSDRLCDDTECVSLVSQFVTLEPGDVIMTGTPGGAMDSIVERNDTVVHTIEGIGRLSYRIG